MRTLNPFEPVKQAKFESPELNVTLVDPHVHTNYSDGAATVKDVEKICLSKQIGCCITDHNEIRGSLKLYDRQRIPTIPSIEIGSREQIELILFFKHADECEEFFKTQIEPYRQRRLYAYLPRSLEYLVAAAKEHEVIVSIPHPFAPLWKNMRYGGKRRDAIFKTIDMADCIEVFNGALTQKANRQALNLCQSMDKTPLGGSDSHEVDSIGSVVVAFNQDINSSNLYENIDKDQIFGIWGLCGQSHRHLSTVWNVAMRHSRKFIDPADMLGRTNLLRKTA